MTSQHTRVCWLLVLAFLTVCVEGFAPGTAIRLRRVSVSINMGQKPPEARLQLPQAKLEAVTANKKQWGISDSATGVPAGADMPQARQFLLSIMSSRTSQAEKKKLIEISRQMRVNGEAEYLAFLETLLNEVDSVKNNKFAMTRWRIAIPSYRVKLGCLNRVLTQLLQEGMDENVRREGLRIRTLATLVRQLEVSKDVRALESDALNGKNEVTMADMLKRTPAGLETPAYKVLEEKGRWELRQYVDFSVCSFDMQASPERAGYGAFNALAGYIFGRNQEQVKMAMTTPVINHGASKKMSFVMPSTYWNENAPPAPTPMADSGVKLEGSGGGMISKSAQVAVVWFGGFASKELVSQKKALLKSLLESDPQWQAVDVGAEPLLLQVALAVTARAAPVTPAAPATAAAPASSPSPAPTASLEATFEHFIALSGKGAMDLLDPNALQEQEAKEAAMPGRSSADALAWGVCGPADPSVTNSPAPTAAVVQPPAVHFIS